MHLHLTPGPQATAVARLVEFYSANRTDRITVSDPTLGEGKRGRLPAFAGMLLVECSRGDRVLVAPNGNELHL